MAETQGLCETCRNDTFRIFFEFENDQPVRLFLECDCCGHVAMMEMEAKFDA